MPPTDTEGKKNNNIGSCFTGSQGLEGRTNSKNIAPDQFFFLLSVVFLEGPYEIEPGTMICPFFKACQANH